MKNPRALDDMVISMANAIIEQREQEIEALKSALSQLIVAGERYKSGDGDQWTEYLNFGNAIDKAKEALK